MHLYKTSKNKLNFKDKPWTTPGLQKSISTKNQVLSKFLKLKDPLNKEAHIKYKRYRNLLSALLEIVKNFVLPDFFKNIL